jgi:hypothetical protein
MPWTDKLIILCKTLWVEISISCNPSIWVVWSLVSYFPYLSEFLRLFFASSPSGCFLWQEREYEYRPSHCITDEVRWVSMGHSEGNTMYVLSRRWEIWGRLSWYLQVLKHLSPLHIFLHKADLPLSHLGTCYFYCDCNFPEPRAQIKCLNHLVLPWCLVQDFLCTVIWIPGAEQDE